MSTYKDELRTWLVDNVDPESLVKDDGSRAPHIATYAFPDNILVKDIFVKDGIYIVFTVKRIRSVPGRHTLNVPKRYHNYFEVGIFTIDRPDADGDVLRDTALEALETAFEDSPTDTSPYREFTIFTLSDNDHIAEGIMLYNTNVIIQYIVHES